MVLGPHGVPGGNVPLRVVEEHRNVTERAQNQPQIMEGRIVPGLIRTHKTATQILVQVSFKASQ